MEVRTPGPHRVDGHGCCRRGYQVFQTSVWPVCLQAWIAFRNRWC